MEICRVVEQPVAPFTLVNIEAFEERGWVHGLVEVPEG